MNTDQLIIKSLEGFWPKNKAKGLLAQGIFNKEIRQSVFGNDALDKIMPGCWLLSPKESNFYKFRFSFFVHPIVVENTTEISNPKELLGDKYRPFNAIAEFLNNAGIGVVYVVASTEDGKLPAKNISEGKYDDIRWNFFLLRNGNFIATNPEEFFSKWGGGRGRPSHGGEWETKIKDELLKAGTEVLTAFLLEELFYTGYLKATLHKSINDPYDVDAYLMSLSQQHIFPMEIKEKFPAGDGAGMFFGIDAGRIMMLLRLCMPNDANGIYLIRELNEEGRFIGWKYITLSDIILTASWNLQAGGPGMGGQSTQTVKLPYHCFKDFDSSMLSEDGLKKIGNLPEHIKEAALAFGTEISTRFNT